MPALKENLDRPLLEALAGELRSAWPAFPTATFLADAGDGLEALELKDRVRQVAAALERALPGDATEVVAILERALASARFHGWMVWPCTELVGRLAPSCPEVVVPFMARLTSRSSCEFAIRPCIEQHPELTFGYLHRWADDPDEHVRRLVSEGTRPRLPWGERLRSLQQDPSPALALLDRLRDDPSEYVRRSVANHLGDIAKDHPDLALAVAARWMEEGGRHVDGVVRHGLRALIKAGHPGALALVGFDARATVQVESLLMEPARLAIGGQATLSVRLRVEGDAPVPVVVEYRIHFLGPRGPRKPKAFRLAERVLEPGVPADLRRRHTFDHASIRTLHPGEHLVEVQVNGQILGSCVVELLPV
jgi:3-methyladenine DNA glycosylase AlkC